MSLVVIELFLIPTYTVHVQKDDDEVKMIVGNSGGAKNLIVTYTIISKRPIDRRNDLVVKRNNVEVPIIYQVAEVRL